MIMSAIELVDTEERTVRYDDLDVPLTVGRARAHAVSDDTMDALCTTAQRRILPTGWAWLDPHPEHMERCARCLEMFPLDPGDLGDR